MQNDLLQVHGCHLAGSLSARIRTTPFGVIRNEQPHSLPAPTPATGGAGLVAPVLAGIPSLRMTDTPPSAAGLLLAGTVAHGPPGAVEPTQAATAFADENRMMQARAVFNVWLMVLSVATFHSQATDARGGISHEIPGYFRSAGIKASMEQVASKLCTLSNKQRGRGHGDTTEGLKAIWIQALSPVLFSRACRCRPSSTQRPASSSVNQRTRSACRTRLATEGVWICPSGGTRLCHGASPRSAMGELFGGWPRTRRDMSRALRRQCGTQSR